MIYYTMIHHRYQLRLNCQLQSVILSSELKNKSLKNFRCRCQLGNKDSRDSFKQNIFNFPNFLKYNFIKDEMFKEATFASKNTAKFKDFTMLNLHPTNIFYIQIVPTGVRLDPTQNLTVNWIIKQQQIIFFHLKCFIWLKQRTFISKFFNQLTFRLQRYLNMKENDNFIISTHIYGFSLERTQHKRQISTLISTNHRVDNNNTLSNKQNIHL